MRRSAEADHVTGQRADRRALAEIVDLIDDGVYDAASVLAWEVQRTSPGDPNVWLLLARLDHLRERYAAAIYAARMATRLDPSSADAWIILAQTAVRRERWWTEGLDTALQATALAPEDAEPWTALARLQLAAGERYDAAVAAERAVAIDADHRGAHVVLGEIALATGEWRHAAAAFRRALELDGDDRDARVGLATALEAQDIDPADELARYGSPVVLQGRGRKRWATRGRVGRAASHPLVVDNRRLLIGIGTCLAAGVVLGVVIPAVGALRGLVGAVAVLLMWFAVGPLRTRRVEDVDVAAADAARDEVIEAAATDGAPDAEALARAGRGGSANDATSASDDPEATKTRSPRALVEGEWGPPETSSPMDDEDTAATVDDGGPDVAPPADAASDARAEGGTGTATGETQDFEADDAGASPVVAEPGAGRAVPAADEAAGADVAEPDGMTAAEASDDDQPRRGAASAPPREVDDLPHEPDALIELSRRALAQSNLELAHAAASRLEAVAPGTVEAHRALGAAALAEHDYDQARMHYGKVLELEPLDQEAHERLAMIGEQRPRGRLRRFRGWR